MFSKYIKESKPSQSKEKVDHFPHEKLLDKDNNKIDNVREAAFLYMSILSNSPMRITITNLNEYSHKGYVELFGSADEVHKRDSIFTHVINTYHLPIVKDFDYEILIPDIVLIPHVFGGSKLALEVMLLHSTEMIENKNGKLGALEQAGRNMIYRNLVSEVDDEYRIFEFNKDNLIKSGKNIIGKHQEQIEGRNSNEGYKKKLILSGHSDSQFDFLINLLFAPLVSYRALHEMLTSGNFEALESDKIFLSSFDWGMAYYAYILSNSIRDVLRENVGVTLFIYDKHPEEIVVKETDEYIEIVLQRDYEYSVLNILNIQTEDELDLLINAYKEEIELEERFYDILKDKVKTYKEYIKRSNVEGESYLRSFQISNKKRKTNIAWKSNMPDVDFIYDTVIKIKK